MANHKTTTSNEDELNRYRLVLDDKIVAEFTPNYDSPAEQAVKFRDKNFPGAKIYTLVWEYEDEADESL